MARHLNIHYIYEGTESTTVNNEKMMPLPDHLRQTIQEAVKNLDVEAIHDATSQISLTDKNTASTITTLIDNFEYEKISQLVEKTS